MDTKFCKKKDCTNLAFSDGYCAVHMKVSKEERVEIKREKKSWNEMIRRHKNALIEEK